MARLTLHSCEIDPEQGWVWFPDEVSQTRLNDVLLRLLAVLVRNAGRDVSHDELRQEVWADRLDRESEIDRKQKMRKVYIAITRLRRVILDDIRPYRHIVSSQVGFYRFEPLLSGEGHEPSHHRVRLPGVHMAAPSASLTNK